MFTGVLLRLLGTSSGVYATSGFLFPKEVVIGGGALLMYEGFEDELP